MIRRHLLHGGARRQVPYSPRTSAERACASSPSARASVVIAGVSFARRLAAEFLHRDHFDEVRCGKSAAQARRSGCRQHVIGAGSVIARRLPDSPRRQTPRPRGGSSPASCRRAAPDVRARERSKTQRPARANRRRRWRRCFRWTDARRAPSAASQVALDFFCNRLGETARRGEQNRGRIDIVLGLRQHIGGDPARIAVGGDDDDLGGAGDEVDAGFSRDQFLCGGDINIARADDAVDFRHRLRSVSETPRWPARLPCGTCDVTPNHSAMPMISGLGFGHATHVTGTPATCAGITVINRVEGRG